MSGRLPAFFIPHGGGPCFFMDWNPPGIWDRMGHWLTHLSDGIRPKAVLVISAHWEEPEFTIGSNPAPPLIFDYYGFPPHTYQLQYPAPGAPRLAERIADLLHGQGIQARLDHERGYDHGVFIPFLLIYPKADVPILQISLQAGLDAAAHLAAGRALAPLRDEGVLVVGSGMSYHNLQKFMRGDGSVIPDSDAFDQWLTNAVTAPAAQRAELLTAWRTAPAARDVHPREEHLLPLMVVAGAAGDDVAERTFSDRVMGAMISGYRFG